MNRTFALIENGIVTNVIVAEDWQDGVNITHLDPRPGIGWAYDGAMFAAPIREEVLEPEPLTQITKLEFLRRFTMEERIAARSLTATNPVVQDAQELMAMAEFISVNDPDTVQYVYYLESIEVLAAGRAAEILGQ